MSLFSEIFKFNIKFLSVFGSMLFDDELISGQTLSSPSSAPSFHRDGTALSVLNPAQYSYRGYSLINPALSSIHIEGIALSVACPVKYP